MNPADAESNAYQGYSVIQDKDPIKLHIKGGELLTEPNFIVSKVLEAQAYHLQIATDEAFVDILYDRDDFNDNLIDAAGLGTLLSKGLIPYYCRVCVKVGEAWGNWSDVGTFYYLHPQTVYFDAQGGSVPSPPYKTAIGGFPYGEVPVATHPNKVFDGWWSKPDGDGIRIAPTEIVPMNEGHIAYAKWRNYTATFDSQGGSAVPAVENLEHGTTIPLPEVPQKDGYLFNGWYKESALINQWNFSEDTINSDITMYAKWFGGPVEVGNPGPGGGYVFYDKGVYSDGWRFLEAAPSDIKLGESVYFHIFGHYRINPNGYVMEVGTSSAIGEGKSNTEALVAAMGSAAYTEWDPSKTTTTGDYAAKLCYLHEAGGYDDWFLPSKDELNLMYVNLKSQGIGGLSAGYEYWSSSEIGSHLAWMQNFYNGDQYSNYSRASTLWVRPVRAF